MAMASGGTAMRIAAHAKINLFLHVLARETSGFHQIETLFCRLDLADTLDIEPGEPGIALHVEGMPAGPPADNLVVRAARLFCARTGLQPALRIALHKHIPVGAGLGGGSSDAAATLRALEAMQQDVHGATTMSARSNAPVRVTRGQNADSVAALPANRDAGGQDRVLAMASALGSDVPFFASDAALALAWGRGERLLALPALPVRPILIVVPPTPIATADAYRAVAARREGANPPAAARMLAAHQLADWDDVARMAYNDFEDVAFDRVSGLRKVRDALRDGGARIALLCGSGSALFAVFDASAVRDAVAGHVRRAFPDHTCIETRTASGAVARR